MCKKYKITAESSHEEYHKGEIENLTHNAQNPHSLSSNFVRTCCEDNLGNIWIGTFNGLNRYNKSTRLFQNHTARIDQKAALTHSSIWCIVKDQQGTLWMGTYFGGVNYFNPEYEIYTRYTYSPTEKKGLSHPIVGRTIEDKDGNLWIGTEGGGLNFYNRQTNEFKWFLPGKAPYGLSNNNIKALYYDDARKALWIGVHVGGLNKLDLRTGHITHYRMQQGNPETLPSRLRRAFAQVYRNLKPGGLFLFDAKTPLALEEADGQTYLDEDESLMCVWRADYEPRRRICGYGIDLFTLRPDGAWNRESEYHEEYAYTPQELTDFLTQAGFSSIKQYSNLKMCPPKEEDRRIFFAARKEQ